MNLETLIPLRAIDGVGCTADEALAMATDADLDALKQSATRVRESHFGRRIDTCIIINARCGACSNDCRFCSQSAHYRTDVETHPMLDANEMTGQTLDAFRQSASHCGIVTAGPSVDGPELDTIEQTVRQVRDCNSSGDGKQGQSCASLGRLSGDSFARLRAAGLTRYHHNLETSESFYSKICSTQDWRERVETVRRAQAAGLEVCCGGLFGMGESWADRIDLAMTLRELGITSVPINFLTPVPGTPLEDQPRLTADEALRIIAVYRMLLPGATLRICGGRPQTLGERQSEMFAAGANAIMTGNYLTTSGITPESDRAMINGIGLELE